MRSSVAEWTVRANADLHADYVVVAPVVRFRPAGLAESALGEVAALAWEAVLFVFRWPALVVGGLMWLLGARSGRESYRGRELIAVSDDRVALLALPGLPWKRKARLRKSWPRSEAGLLMRVEPHGRHYQIQVDRTVWLMNRRYGDHFSRPFGLLEANEAAL